MLSLYVFFIIIVIIISSSSSSSSSSSITNNIIRVIYLCDYILIRVDRAESRGLEGGAGPRRPGGALLGQPADVDAVC